MKIEATNLCSQTRVVLHECQRQNLSIQTRNLCPHPLNHSTTRTASQKRVFYLLSLLILEKES